MSQSSDGAWRYWAFNAGEQRPGTACGVIVDELPIAELLGRSPSASVMDLIELVAAVHLIDRAEARPSARKPGDSWTRHIQLTIGVREPKRWAADAVHDELVALLRSVTDDVWSIEFVPRLAASRPAECVQFLFQSAPAGDAVALFGGGLDSLAGLAADVAGGVTPLALSIETNRRLAKSQRDVLASFNQALGAAIVRVPIELHLKSAPAVESSQRARGFGFLALGATLATLAKLESVHVYENGIGAINPPYTPAQTGAHGTRAMRPETLEAAQRLFSMVLDHSLIIVNRSQYLTKAEMCRGLPDKLHAAVAMTESCDTAFSYRGGTSSCGRCTSCLLRRQAMACAGLGGLDPSSKYRLDAFAGSSATAEDLYCLRAMLSQASRLQRAIGADSSAWPRLVQEFPDLVRAVQALRASLGGQPEIAISEMLRRYVNEWATVPSPLVASYLGNLSAAA